MSRISDRFAALRQAGRGGLIPFITAGDPDRDTTARLLAGLPAAGADLIELGLPFSDPMADGPAIQEASERALKAGASTARTLDLVREFRETDTTTPVVLMGYYNPVFVHGPERFARDAAAAGVDGIILVDLPPEEADEFTGPARAAGLDFIVLTAPTTDDARLPRVLANAGGFVYYVSVAGVTGTRAAEGTTIRDAVDRLRRFTDLPLAVGFGIRTPDQAAEVAAAADAAVVGSAVIGRIADNLDADGRPAPGLVDDTLRFVGELAAGVRKQRGEAP